MYNIIRNGKSVLKIDFCGLRNETDNRGREIKSQTEFSLLLIVLKYL